MDDPKSNPYLDENATLENMHHIALMYTFMRVLAITDESILWQMINNVVFKRCPKQTREQWVQTNYTIQP